MTKHILSLDIPVTYNPKVLRIVDTSQYAENIPVNCSRLLITPPGYNLPVEIDVDPGATQILSACCLDIQRTGCDDSQVNLPDGIYIIRYEVSPLDKVFVEYNHLRVTNIMNRYFEELGKVCLNLEEPTWEATEDLDALGMIKSYIDAAVVKVEIRHEPGDGMALVDYASRRLQRYTRKSRC